MTVQELIDKLSEISNKSLPVLDYEDTEIEDVEETDDAVKLE